MRTHRRFLERKYGIKLDEQPFLTESILWEDSLRWLFELLEDHGVDIRETFSEPVSEERWMDLLETALAKLYGWEKLPEIDFSELYKGLDEFLDSLTNT
jgi:hypothetical protein